MFRRYVRVALSVAMLSTLPAVSAAQTSQSSADAQSIRVGATIFYDYTHTFDPKKTDSDGNEISPSAFDVKRAYINIRGTVSRVVSFRITPDIKRETGSGSSLNGSLTFRLKYAYAQFNLDEWLPAGSQVRLGIIQTPYIEAQEGIYRYRFQGTLFAERDGGLSSADAGVSYGVPLPDGYGNIKVGWYNGDGYSKAEANDQKSLQVLAHVRPLPEAEGLLEGLRVSAFYNADHYVKDAPRRRFIANATLEHERFNAGLDLVTGTDRESAADPSVSSRGVSFFVTPFFTEKGNGWEGLLRLDRWDDDTDVAGVQNRSIIGAAYWFPHPGGSATAAILFDLEMVRYSGFAIERENERRFSVHGLINF